ncbi:hypothetical protein RJ639_005369 [Escallonia herrerae]|uniref:Uncharacterized protein n=1 Tax=Escallonia herrerae TaxID=1293975 RepID=A0AA88VVQ6_9ASTE|nr:hypothetical protein RJ639_005369 [Escallonia herrerae]
MTGKGNRKLREEEEQDAHTLCEMRPPQLPPPEEPLLRLQLECEGNSKEDHRNWSYEVPPSSSPQVPKRFLGTREPPQPLKIPCVLGMREITWLALGENAEWKTNKAGNGINRIEITGLKQKQMKAKQDYGNPSVKAYMRKYGTCAG